MRTALLAVLLSLAAAAAEFTATATELPPRQAHCQPRARVPRSQHAECTHLVREYMQEHTADFDAPHDVDKMLFFLHVPRTAGKTYANCFLRTALPPSKRCAKSYDVLRLNASLPGCQALVSHDDFSISQFFPPAAATITQLRRPVERLISSYEFAVDVAAKGVLRLETPRKNPKRRADFVGTLEVWPWSILIPWFKRDMAARMEKLRLGAIRDPTAWRNYTSPKNRTYYWNEAKNSSVWTLPEADPVLNPYNNSLVMPLHEFIEHPIAAELLHNGGTLQVLGLTNYSYWPRQAQALRHCVTANSVAREMLLTLATKRLKHMAHVGITERLEESVLSLAADMALNLSSPAYKYTSSSAFTYDEGASDDEDPLTFLSFTIEQGQEKNVTLTRREAALHMEQIAEEQRLLKLETEEMAARLNVLVNMEARWLDEQDAPQLDNADGGFVQERRQEAQDSQVAAGAEAVAREGPENCSASADGSCSVDLEGQQLQQQGAGHRTDFKSAADVIEQQDVQQQGLSEELQQQDGQQEGAGQQQTEEAPQQEQLEAQAEGEEEEEGSTFDNIDSPWSEEIVALDNELLAKKERLRQVDTELLSLQNSGLVVSADEATGRAKQLIPDQYFLMLNDTLGQAYVRCAAAGKGRREKRKVYRDLRTPWGETFEFGSGSRALIAPEIRFRIHQLNSLDEELWKAGNKLLEGKLAEQREAGLLQTFPPWTAAGKQRRHQGRNETSTRRRALQSDEEAKPGEGQKGKPTVHDSGESLYASEPAASAEDDATRQGTAAADAAALGADVSTTAAASGAEATTTEAHTRLTAAEARGVGDAANNVGGNTNALSHDDGFQEAASSEAPAQLLQDHDEL
ncbi:Protein-tyrosine sulfotransferase [Chlorella vulgaris]